QFNRKEGGILEPLPRKNIDTGMGLERLAALMQGVYSNFETDLFEPIIKEIEKGQSPSGTVPEKGLTYAIADHLRAITFSIYDGIMPSNDGRGYVARKLIRKSTLHLRALGHKQPLLYKLVPALSEVMKNPYPELGARKENIAEIILREEKSFIATLNSSETLFKDKFSGLKNKSDPDLTGKIAFQLYDTYGIPLELTNVWLDKQGIGISEEAFNDELIQQKNRSKSQSSMKGDVFQIKDFGLGAKETKFSGYKDYVAQAKVIKIIKGDSAAKKVSVGDTAKIVLDKTVFYPEGGGQVGDSGEIIKGKNIFEVIDTQKTGKAIVHIGRVKEGAFKNNDSVYVRINLRRRLSIARNHTATHILQSALREVLGGHVKQQGSLVAEDRLRFDFTHFQDIKKEELDRIEEVVNNRILDNYSLCARQMALSAAKKAGALAFFGEKYADKVRVVSVGDFSRELCGGTHLDHTGQIGIFKITQEGSVASGVRRIEAATGAFAYKLVKEEENILADIAGELNAAPERIAQELQKRLSRLKELEKQLNAERLNLAVSSIDAMLSRAEEVNKIKVIAQMMENADMNLLRKTIDLIKEKAKNCVVALGSSNQGRALLVMGLTPDLAQKGLDASKLITEVAKLIGGSGGGRKDFAQAGGTKPENFNLAFQELKKRIAGL
ncbi:alanine--tRNA ligase, partial [bacterium]